MVLSAAFWPGVVLRVGMAIFSSKGILAGAGNYRQDFGQESASYGWVMLIGPILIVIGSNSQRRSYPC
jgi:uncharacterized membrane protein